MPGWHHRLHEHGFEQTLGNSEGQEGLGCCSAWGHKESYVIEQLTNNIDILKGHREEHGPTNIAQELFNFWFSPSIETKNSKKCFNSFKSYFKN